MTVATPAPAREASKAYRTELSPVSFLRRSACVYPDKVAVVHGDRRITYRELDERVNRLASALILAGIAPGDRVAFLAPNIPPLLEAHYGVPAAGAVLVTINTRLGRDEVAYILRHCGARMVFADHELLHLVEGCGLPTIRIDDTGAPGDPYEDFLAGGFPERCEVPVADEEQLISINYTSGTTGRPKGVMYTHRSTYLNSLMEALESHLRPDSVLLWVVPMFHCNGWCFTWAATAVGARHVCMRKPDPATMWQLFDREGVTHYNGAPTVQWMILDHPRAHPLERPVTAMVAAAPPSPTLFARMSELNFRIVHVYGLTETYGPTTVSPEQEAWSELPIAERAKLLARQGQAYLSSDLIRVVDEQMEDVPQNGETMGEVVMRGNIVMSGYFEDKAATDKAFAGGWFHSGDLAVWYADGNIELRDRGKDIIISGGENISSIEVQQTLMAHPDVADAAVIGVPDERWGERPKAFITLRDGASTTAEELIAFCRDRLAHFKCPDTVEFGPLPKTSTGKVQKFLLREREWAGHDKRIGAA